MNIAHFHRTHESARNRDRRLGPPRQSYKNIQDNHRAVISLIAQGLNNLEIVREMSSRGVAITPQTISRIRNDSLTKMKIEDMLSRVEEKTVDRAALVRDMAADAFALMHKAAMTGVLNSPAVDEDGNVLPGQEVPVPVSISERLRAARRVADAHHDTASVTRVNHRAEPFDDKRHALVVERMQQALLERQNAIPVQIIGDPL